MTDEDLYICSVQNWRNEELLRITGTRTTVIETALRVMLDYAPAYDPRRAFRPQFGVDVSKIAR